MYLNETHRKILSRDLCVTLLHTAIEQVKLTDQTVGVSLLGGPALAGSVVIKVDARSGLFQQVEQVRQPVGRREKLNIAIRNRGPRPTNNYQ